MQGSFIIEELVKDVDAKELSRTAQVRHIRLSYLVRSSLRRSHTCDSLYQAVLLAVNPCDQATFSYAVRQLPNFGPDVFVCVLVCSRRSRTRRVWLIPSWVWLWVWVQQALFQDKKDQWAISREQMESAISRQKTFVLECSNVNNYGLEVLYKFFELPFLVLQVNRSSSNYTRTIRIFCFGVSISATPY